MAILNRFFWLLVPATALFSCTLRDTPIEEPESDSVDEAMKHELIMTRDPQLGIIPRERLMTARAYMESLMSSPSTARTNALAWQERGPNNIGGRTRAMIIDKRDASGNTVLAGSVSGGMFKTTNLTSATTVWTPVDDFLPNLAITAMVQDNANPNIMYAGTGEGWLNIDAVRGAGIFRSTDGGTTWTVIPSTTTFEYVQDIVIDNNGNLYASLRNLQSLNRGVVRSTDNGATWTQVLGAPLAGFATGRATDLEVASNGDIYASLGMAGQNVANRSVVMKSSFATHGANTGALDTWTNITPVTPTVTQRTEIILAPSDPTRVYLLMQDSATDEVRNIFRSTNGGSSWTTLIAPAALNGNAPQAWYNLIGAVDPANPDILIAGALHLVKSTNAGDTWTAISNSSTVHVDQHFVQYTGSTRLLVGNDGGVYNSSNAEAVVPAFTNKNNGFNVTQYYACDYHPTDVNYFLAGAQDNGTERFTTAGINTAPNVTGGDGGFCHIDQTEPLVQVASFFGSAYAISNNGFSTFTIRNFNPSPEILGQFINPSDYDDNNNLFYAGGDANTYTYITNLIPATSATLNTANVPLMGGRELTAVKIDPSAANTIFVGASFGGAVPQILKISSANTNSPTVISTANLGTISNAAISSVDVDPANSNHIVATLSNYGVVSVWESTNGGVSFTNIEGNLPDMPIRWALIAPSTAQLNGTTGGNGGILLGTELGVWTTSLPAGAATVWAPNNSGLANVRTDMLKYNAATNILAAATHGRGLFTSMLPNVVTGVPNEPVTPNFIRYISAESGQLLIAIGRLQTRTMNIQIINMSGQQVYRSDARYENTGIPIGNLAKGVYILKLRGNNKEHFVQQFVNK